MRRFVTQTGLFLLLIGALFLMMLSLADGNTDPFYLRFTTPKQSSLILGTSRAAQGLQPAAFNEELGKDIFNYAFSISHSPFGSTYFESVKRKLQQDTSDGIFIITVDPWSISSATANPNDSANFREKDLALGNTRYVNMKPNFFYLLQNLSGDYYKILRSNTSGMFLHRDGWLEVTVPMDSSVVERRVEAKVRTYQQRAQSYKFSSFRLEYLKKLIHYLKNRGEVYLVRLPMHPKMFEVENQFMPDLTEKVQGLLEIPGNYLDMTESNSDFTYTDGNHLHRSSGKIVSQKIANWIVTRPAK